MNTSYDLHNEIVEVLPPLWMFKMDTVLSDSQLTLWLVFV